jgi:ABC-type glycerol-3-phosphate transport system permease component
VKTLAGRPLRDHRRRPVQQPRAVRGGSLLTALPVVLLFQYLQRYIVGGLTAGGVKG